MSIENRLQLMLALCVTGLALFLFSTIAPAEPVKKNEDYWNRAWCESHDLYVTAEFSYRVSTPHGMVGGRVDCILDGYAIEADWVGKSLKRYEAIGQASAYAQDLNLLPGILFIIRNENDCKYFVHGKRKAERTYVVLMENDQRPALHPIRVWSTGDWDCGKQGAAQR